MTGPESNSMQPDPGPSPQTPQARKAKRYQPRQRSTWQRIPISVKLLVPVVLGIGGLFGYDLWRGSHAVLKFDNAGAVVPPLELTIFSDAISYSAPSPAAPIARVEVQGDEILMGKDLVADTALVCFRGEGIGTGYTRVEVGAPPQLVRLGPPGRMRGRVVSADGVLLFGLRCAGLVGVPGAKVQGFGGGERGVLLCESVTDQDGWFELEGYDQRVSTLGIRVLAAGQAMKFQHWVPGSAEPTIPVIPTAAIRGSVELPEAVSMDSLGALEVLVRGLPGIRAAVQNDGSFTIDHVKAGLEPRLMLHGLPDGFTHKVARGSPGNDKVRIEVLPATTLRGWVLDMGTQRPLIGALVWHSHGPDGRVITATGEDGSFELPRTPPGEIILRAQHTAKTKDGKEFTRGTERTMLVELGNDQKIVLRIE